MRALPASQYDDVVGQRAASDIPAGGLVTPDSVSATAVPPSGKSVVGVALTPAQQSDVQDLELFTATAGARAVQLKLLKRQEVSRASVQA